MNVKTLVDQKVISPSLNFTKDEEDIVAQVIKSNHDNGTCDVKYDSSEGETYLENAVVRMGFAQIFNFPEEGDYVYMDIRNGSGIIKSYESSYDKDRREAADKLKNDNYSDMVSTDTQGGWIY